MYRHCKAALPLLVAAATCVFSTSIASASTHAAHAHHAMTAPTAGTSTAAGAPAAMAPLTDSALDWFTNWGSYMPRTHCLTTEAGAPDWPWIAALFGLTTTVIVGYLRIFWFWRKSYLAEEERDRNRKMMSLAYIFLWCAVCGYGLSLVMYYWPVYRLLAFCLLTLNFFTWRFAWNLNDFKLSLSARRLARELEESLRTRNEELERQVADRTAELEAKHAALVESESRFNRMVANVPGMMFQFAEDADGARTMPYVSEYVREIYGVTAAEVHADPALLVGRVDPQDAGSLEEATCRSRDRLEPFEWEGRVIDGEGRPRWVRIQSRPERRDDGTTCWDGILTDISDQKRHEQELRKLSLIADATDSAVIVTSATGDVEFVNPAFERITGYSFDEVVGQRPGEMLQGPATDPDTIAMMRERLAAGEGFECELLNYHKSGAAYWLALEVRPVRDAAGTLTQYVALERDITEQKRVSQELADALQAAEAASRAKSEFLANISHEIRTPLGAVIGFGDLLLEDLRREAAGDADARANPERLDWAQTIHGSGKHLMALINDVLDLSKIEAGKMEFERMACSPHDILSEVLSVMRVPASAKGLDLSLRYLTPIPRQIETDPTRLKQVIFNLVNNAVKFTQSGTVRVLASCDFAGSEPHLTVHVADTGIGMTDAQRGRLFTAFSQADGSVTRRFGGTGLGLCISKHIAEGLGGGIDVQSRFGIGSTFSVTVAAGVVDADDALPAGATEVSRDAAEEPAGEIASPTPAPALPASDGPLSNRRVLVVDDGVTNRKLIGLLLRREGVSVTEADNGRRAVDLLADGLEVDVVLMDMQMPELDGYTAVRLLRDRGYDKPIVALTAHAMSGDRDRCLSAGCDGYLTKPVDRDALLAAVARPSGEDAAPAIEQAAPERSVENDRVFTDREPLTSTLPTDDAEFAEIAAEFVGRASERLAEFEQAAAAADLVLLAELAHWLRGVSGSAGYPPISQLAERVEKSAKAPDAATALDGIADRLSELRQLIDRAVAGLDEAPNKSAAATLS